MTLKISGKIWIDKDSKHFLGSGRIQLLESIEKFGSITKAAKAMQISYKTAWDYINEMNSISGEPLIITAIGGKSGGGAKITTRGKELIRFFRNMEKHLRIFLKGRDLKNSDFNSLIKIMGLKTSARNQLVGKVISIKKDSVNCEILLELKGNLNIKATITKESLRNLKIKLHDVIIAIIKASSIMVMKKNNNLLIGSDNILPGKVSNINEGSINAEVSILTQGGDTITSIISKTSVKAIGLKKYDEVFALFNASNVILGVIS